MAALVNAKIKYNARMRNIEELAYPVDDTSKDADPDTNPGSGSDDDTKPQNNYSWERQGSRRIVNTGD